MFSPTVLDSTHVSHDDLLDAQLNHLAAPIDAEETLIVDGPFECAKLNFLAVVVGRRYQDDDDDGDQDRDSVDPLESGGRIFDSWKEYTVRVRVEIR